ncbi:MAG: 50S ribosomal protein L30e [Candidatus Micrarchaeia archaeon]
MTDLSGDIRLAVDSGKVAIGANSVIASITTGTAKLVVLSPKGKQDPYNDILHLAKLSELRIIKFEGNPIELGAVCGKPFPVSAIAIINPGNSNILNEDYSKQTNTAEEEKKAARKEKKEKRRKAKEEAIEKEEEEARVDNDDAQEEGEGAQEGA